MRKWRNDEVKNVPLSAVSNCAAERQRTPDHDFAISVIRGSRYATVLAMLASSP